MNLNNLIAICEKNKLPRKHRAIIPEPYAPFIPKNWNGILILAEAQNLSKNSSEYREKLKNLSTKDKILRLYKPGLSAYGLGIQPWDDGSLKLAVLSMFPNESIDDFAVSNAVPWSVVKSNDSNKNPTDSLEARATLVWNEFLPVLKPKLIICAGKTARRVIGARGIVLSLRLPSPYFTRGLADLFNPKDLLLRYPEVKSALTKLPGAVALVDEPGKILYACHAVSRLKARPL